MDYEITKLSNELIYIRWYRSPSPSSKVESKFLSDLKILLDETENPVYFISDLRRGRIINVLTLQKLAELASHKNWGGSTAFSSKSTTEDFVRTFAILARQDNPLEEHQDTPEAAVAYLERMKPGITDGVNWVEVLDV